MSIQIRSWASACAVTLSRLVGSERNGKVMTIIACSQSPRKPAFATLLHEFRSIELLINTGLISSWLSYAGLLSIN